MTENTKFKKNIIILKFLLNIKITLEQNDINISKKKIISLLCDL